MSADVADVNVNVNVNGDVGDVNGDVKRFESADAALSAG